MNTSVAIDNQHREEAIEQAHSPISETKAIRSTSTKEKPNYELLAAQLDEIKADIKRKVGAEDAAYIRRIILVQRRRLLDKTKVQPEHLVKLKNDDFTTVL